MRVVIASLLILFFMLCNSITYAKNYGSSLCKNSQEFSCYTVGRHDSWESLFPDEQDRDLVMRANRMNTHLYRGLKIAVPNDLYNINMMDISPMPRQISPTGDKIIFVSLRLLAFGAYDEDGNLLYWGPVSGGRGYCPDLGRACHTMSGTFTVYRKEGEGCFSTKFPVGRGGAPMPYCMFFHNGFALHGSYEVPGYNDSHGCVRMFVNDAKWLNENFIMDRTDIHVVIDTKTTSENNNTDVNDDDDQ